mmetsp:Transcript_71729/g.126609  ORF Transcript_71729/g.126609 Transcript_71729/m.126609 type:complete len:123 (+) Transcript_71729:404-772(+)|eukprot:CAMPEP_0197659350 /NCGR_PEP_ID=MMETSP1338-20131121/47358_1 /TAXON_ID=43686 ORGANISM="Pelagodinium beii, Strain RCC1491" /NCGR_SAMPLE_ID=MMETSP1338 /ASSEMBLY_ACC=CAM_ASM_000754 /LENGTH=122 /DNA_ID=CAMNT_0043236237 /DNA_START=403 /DNA_END=771 /DNA_ORIENTATION=-
MNPAEYANKLSDEGINALRREQNGLMWFECMGHDGFLADSADTLFNSAYDQSTSSEDRNDPYKCSASPDGPFATKRGCGVCEGTVIDCWQDKPHFIYGYKNQWGCHTGVSGGDGALYVECTA